jgi:hypothetical protein
MQLSYKNSYEYLKKIDSLPLGPEFRDLSFTITGDLLGPDGKPQTEQATMWMRDPLECIRELLRNPAFRDCTEFSPCRMYTDATRRSRMYSEMWTGDWWWDTQVSTVRLRLSRYLYSLSCLSI